MLSTVFFVNILVLTAFARTVKRDFVLPIINDWQFQGCYSDDISSRTLSGGAYLPSGSMSMQTCTAFCVSKGYLYAGTEYSSECFCATELRGVKIDQEKCNMACSGDSTQACGGDRTITVYKGVKGPAIAPPVDGYAYLGCYTDIVSSRTLANGIATDGGSATLTAAKCMSACQTAGFKFAGVEYAGECYCGDEILHGGHIAEDGENFCNMPCNGDGSQFCGGPNRLNLYGLKSTSTSSTTISTTTAPVQTKSSPSSGSWTAVGCYTDKVSARTLSNAVQVPGGHLNMTVDGCLQTCAAAGFPIAGLEYSQECFCGNQYENEGTLASDGCSMPCKGDITQICGGPDRLNVYVFGTSSQDTSSTSSLQTSVSSLITSTTTSTATTETTPNTSTTTTTTMTTTVTTTSTTTTASSTPTGLVRNGDFEDLDTTMWSLLMGITDQQVVTPDPNAAKLTIVTSDGNTNQNSAKVVFATNSTDTHTAFLRQTIYPVSGSYYDFSLSYKMPEITMKGGPCQISIGYSTAILRGDYPPFRAVSTYKTVRASAALFGDSVDFNIRIQCFGPGSATFFIDDISVTPSKATFTNVIKNSDFDDQSDTTSWSLNPISGSGTTLDIDTTNPLSGKRSAKITVTTTSTIASWYTAPRAYLSQPLNIAVGPGVSVFFNVAAMPADPSQSQAGIECGFSVYSQYDGKPIDTLSPGQANFYGKNLQYARWSTAFNKGQSTTGKVVFTLGFGCKGPPTKWIFYVDDVYSNYF